MAKPSTEDLFDESSFFDFVSKGQKYNISSGNIRSTAAMNGGQQYAATTHTVADILQFNLIKTDPSDTLLILNKVLTDRLSDFDHQDVTVFSSFSSKPVPSKGSVSGADSAQQGTGGQGTLSEAWVTSLPLKHSDGAVIWQGVGKASQEMHLPTSADLQEDKRQHQQDPALPQNLQHPWYMDRVGGPIGGGGTIYHDTSAASSVLGEPENSAGATGAFGYLDPVSERWYCLPKHSPVSTARGLVQISELKEGELVYSYDMETGALTMQPVVQKVCTGVKATFQVKTKSSSLEATAEHKVLVIEQRGTDLSWQPVSELRVNDFLVILDSESLKIKLEKIKSIIPCAEVEVWDIEVANTHCFFAEGVLVHNCSMAWPFKGDPIDAFTKANRPDLAETAKTLSKSQYKDKRILVYSKQTQRGVVTTPGDWGTQPYWSNGAISKSSINGFYIGLSPDVHQALGTSHGADVLIRFMPDDTPLGPYSTGASGTAGDDLASVMNQTGELIAENLIYAGTKIVDHPNFYNVSSSLRRSLIEGFQSQTSTPTAYIPAWFPALGKGFMFPSLLNYLWIILEAGFTLDGGLGMGYYHKVKNSDSSQLSNHATGGAIDIGGLGFAGPPVGHSHPQWRSYNDQLWGYLATLSRESKASETGSSFDFMYDGWFHVYKDKNPNHIHIGFNKDRIGQLLPALLPGRTTSPSRSSPPL